MTGRKPGRYWGSHLPSTSACWTGALRVSMVPSAHPRDQTDLGVLQLTGWIRTPNFFPSVGEAVHWHQMLWCPKNKLQRFQSVGSVWKASGIMGVGLLLIHTLSSNREKLSGQFEPSHLAGRKSFLCQDVLGTHHIFFRIRKVWRSQAFTTEGCWGQVNSARSLH